MSVRRRIEVPVDDDVVPGLLWSPEPEPGSADRARPTVLIGHGRGAHKGFEMAEWVACRLVALLGAAVVALDAPGHGERRDPAADPDAVPPKPDPLRSGREWRACIASLVRDGVADADRIGYWGLSMGAATGIALMAVEPRVRCGVIGLMHSRYYPSILDDAARVRCPLSFSLHWDDERAPRHDVLDLFDAIGSPDKRLHAYPGGHGDIGQEELRTGEAFLEAHLG